MGDIVMIITSSVMGKAYVLQIMSPSILLCNDVQEYMSPQVDKQHIISVFLIMFRSSSHTTLSKDSPGCS